MRAHLLVAFVVVAAGTAAACHGGGPTTPTAARPATPPPTAVGTPAVSSGEPFDVTGVVTDEQGTPVAGAAVTMAHWLAGRLYRPAVLTDASGGYAFQFSSNPWMSTEGRGAARAEVIADGYDWYWGTVPAANPHVVENVRLQRIKRIPPGGSIVLSVTTENGECLGWLYSPCGRMRVAPATAGNLTIDANPTAASATRPQLQVCCLSGDERYGNPVTLPVEAGVELWVEVGQTAPGVVLSQTVIITTSFQPLADAASLGVH